AWAAAFGLGALSWLVFRIAFRLQILARGPVPERRQERLAGGLALSSALTAALGPLFLLEGSTPGGYSVAAFLALAAVAIGLGAFERVRNAPLAIGVLVAAAAIESRWAAFAAIGSLGVWIAVSRPAVTSHHITSFVIGSASVLLLPVAIAIALWLSPGDYAPYIHPSLAIDGAQFSSSDRSVALETWLSQVGLAWCGLSVCGLAWGVADPRTRGSIVSLGAFIALDAAVGLAGLDPTRKDPYGAIRLLSVGVLATGGAFAVSSVIAVLRRARIPFAPAAGTLLVVYGFTLVFVGAEDSARAAESRERSGSEVWTDEALESLPTSSVVLVRSQTLVLRWWAVRASRGARPDAFLVPLALLERGGAGAARLSREEALLPLVRDVLLSGRPGEFALSALADARPLFLEPDTSWDRRLYAHLVPRPFFTEFAPHPLGRSDRHLGLEAADAAFGRVSAAVQKSPDGDPATRSLLATELTQRAVVLAALGDRADARRVVEQLLALEPRAELGLKLQARLTGGSGPIDVGELLASR
ncbi:MAG TPA: hypothetical protein VIM73_09875, partial [Polyangiaceae bacterium]